MEQKLNNCIPEKEDEVMRLSNLQLNVQLAIQQLEHNHIYTIIILGMKNRRVNHTCPHLQPLICPHLLPIMMYTSSSQITKVCNKINKK